MKGPKIFLVNTQHQADYKVFFVNTTQQEKNEKIIEGGQLVKVSHQADVKVFLVKTQHQADICITHKKFPKAA